MTIRTVDIRPGVSVLSVLRHLNYRPWFAIAEFVDNAIQNFLENRTELVARHGPRTKLRVTIGLHDGPESRLVIRDNAAGIAARDYARAFRPAAVPRDRSGLSEFGMGMKSAACWFASRWQVRTKALGEMVVRTVTFDIDQIVHDDIRELGIQVAPAKPDEHFTEIILDDLHRRPTGRTLGKMKEHLTDIYRVFTRDGTLELIFDGRPLQYEEPAILLTPFFRSPDEPARPWRKDIDFDFGANLRVHGFAAIRATGSTTRAGFALFRRSRLIQGSGDEGYRPDTVFGNTNSYRYQRLFGELHLEGFEVSHTKDGFRWDDNEQPFLDLLREHLDDDDLPLLRQAEGYRARAAREHLGRAATVAVVSTTQALEARLEPVLVGMEETPAQPTNPPDTFPPSETPLAARTIQTRFRGEAWEIAVELTNDDYSTDWVQIADRPGTGVDQQPRCPYCECRWHTPSWSGLQVWTLRIQTRCSV
jgi:Histidine kinase-, DNA gyrase B-, and HSP90-like ATPase